ncbi:hypothetical protein M413DRAFT_442247 [Hebeloma cylindrosporum]|uniref:Uncharacterized protein n=1 Tax=Hebeloma cylindrosporum TaxID=76867 RepID=A0A0C2Y6W9_HEBCY|nr:hypothetical protein M413DRAFT_442247 [Hebeloma cylindrosporum h7]
MEPEFQPSHDEINLVRLLRRIEKSVDNAEEWTPSPSLNDSDAFPEVWFNARKGIQKVKYARTLVKNIELDEFDPSPERIKRLNDFKIRLGRVDSFLKDVEQSSKPKPQRPPPILPTLPLPSVPSKSPPPPAQDAVNPTPHSSPSPKLSIHGLFINPPDAAEISPTLITSALPSLLPSNPSETALASSYSRTTFGPTPTIRRPTTTSTTSTTSKATTTTALQEELSAQLEAMAKQFKRNAIHLSTLLEKDKAAIEDTQLKLEVNHDAMQKERTRLRDHTSKNRWTTVFTLGVVLAVVLVFMLMVSVIRFS